MGDLQDWIEEKEAAQAAKSPFEEPAYFASEVAPKVKVVISAYEKLARKPKPIPPKPEVNVTATNSTDNNSTKDERGESNEPIKVKVDETDENSQKEDESKAMDDASDTESSSQAIPEDDEL